MTMSLEFQIYDYLEDHDSPDTDIHGEEVGLGEYIIHVFGRTMDGQSVYTKVTGFTPYFYINLPDNWETLSDKEIKKRLETMLLWLKSKDNKKVWSKFKESLLEINLLKKKKAEGFTNEKEFNFARLVFNNSIGMKKYSYLFDNQELMIPNVTKKLTKFKVYESNLSPMLRCFHIRKISGCSWVSIENYKKVKTANKDSSCTIEIKANWQDINPIIKENNAPLIIASFDIECFSHDGQFPQANRKKDEIIQIGISYTLLGESIPYRKWIACLDNTDNIDGIIVKSFDTEQELIEAWVNEINEQDCDIITGYNIFYFDEKYIYDRCDKILSMKSVVGYLSKLKNRCCNFKEMKLESSALGQNILNFWETPGRIHIDLMKDVQKTFNLPSYKLDAVASNFIRGEVDSYNKINEFNEFTLNCKSVEDIQLNDYIHIEVIKGFISDEVGDKYLVTKIDTINKILYIKGDLILDAELEISKHGGKIFWSQAKDDIGPKDIFRLQKEGSAERAIVAKYCIKDCSLVNVLINKLEVVTKNIEMANVCYVPLSYLFIRGQGIKLFSLCLKEFREQGYIFPVIKVKKDKDGNLEREDSYEGAIVFDPVAQIDYEANSTKDYASLYPSSILHKNMSHETEILPNSVYDNIEGITYFNADFRENNGTITYIRFAKKDDKLGVIPSILNNLMQERKAVKKLMKSEKNPFKYKILDAKQLAVKVTANSLYGQLGASTSPVANRNIAACTTATGRELLLFAKKYDEEILPWLINGLKDAYENNDSVRVSKLLDLELKSRNDSDLISKIEKYCNTTDGIKNIIFQPVVRYGDTDSVFTCFRFRSDAVLLDLDKASSIFREIIKFGEELINPFFIENELKIFCALYNEYFSTDKINGLSLPEKPLCSDIPNHNKIILSLEERILQFLNEFIYENYFSWLWTLQEVIFKNYGNLDNKIYDWVEYLLQKYKLNYNNFKETRETEVITPIIKIIEETFYYYGNNFKWTKANINIELINNINKLINTLYNNENNFTKEIKNFLENTLKEEWIWAGESHDAKITIEKRKLKRERTFNAKHLPELLKQFIENNLKLNFDKYKNEYELKITNFINTTLKNLYIQPWWDISDNKKIHKIKIYSGGLPIINKQCLELSVELGILSGELVKSHLPFPHDLEYEKTFWPFLIISKKRYVGNKYEFDVNKYKQDYMGIVLKRRDNSPIVKEICSGIIDYLINKKDPEGAKQFAEQCLENMFNNKYDIKYFLQSRTLKLKESYKDWTKIAHVYLAEKLAIRDPGNKPQSGDRIEFAVINPPIDADPKKKILQGEIIDIPSYIKQNNIPINYIFYMKNQIMKPALQFLKLVDPNAEDMFKKMEIKYGNIIIKPKKITKKVKKINTEPKLFSDLIKINKKLKNQKVKVPATSDQSINIVDNLIVEEPIEIIKIKKSKTKKDPIVEEPIVEEPIEIIKIKKSKTKKDSIVEESIVEEPIEIIKIKKSKTKKDPIVEESIVEEPIEIIKIKKSKTKKNPIIDESIVEEPIEIIKIKKSKTKKDPIIEESIVEEPIEIIKIKKSKTKKDSIIEEPIVEEPIEIIKIKKSKTKKDPIIEDPIVEEPIVEESIVIIKIEKSKTKKEPVIEEPVIEEIKIKKSKTKKDPIILEVDNNQPVEVIKIKKNKDKKDSIII